MAKITFCMQAAVELLCDQLIDTGESQPIGALSKFRSKKGIKNPFYLFGRYAMAIILIHQLDLIPYLCPA